MEILLHIGVALIILLLGSLVGYFISRSNYKFDNECLQNKVDELNQRIEDINSGRIKIPIKYGWSTYFVYQDATMEEVVRVIGNPTFVNYNQFGSGKDRLSWYYRCSFGDDPTNDRLIIEFKNNKIIHIEN